MATAPLEDLPTGSDVFIDANIFVYAFDGKSAECRDFLVRCSNEELTGICLFEIVNEVTHVLMIGEARSKGLIAKNGAKALGEKPDLVSHLTQYWEYTERLLSMNLLVLATDDVVVRAAHEERQSAGLLTNDSMIAACMREYGIKHLATCDRSFDRVNGITAYLPHDIH